MFVPGRTGARGVPGGGAAGIAAAARRRCGRPPLWIAALSRPVPGMSAGRKEKRFLDALDSLFTGAEVDGDSGFVNLMRIKRKYFQSIRPQLMAEIDKRAEKDTSFREELFDKLYTFFSRYFCESGSIYFRHLPAFSRIYERVYADGRDVALSWKTRMLYYVKSDVLVRSMPVELNEEGKPQNTRRFYFDASAVEHKKNNERREFVFTFGKVKREPEGRVVHIGVAYSSGGVKTKADEIVKQAREGGVPLTADELHKAIGVFRRQTEADFFINKDAKGFLREQFDLWAYQYIFHGETVFEKKRIRQIQALRDTAYDIIDFIAQFEDELRRAWEKPKFVRGVHYVVTLDRLTDAVLKKITRHKGAKPQIKEWRELGMVDEAFSMKAVFGEQKRMKGNGVNGVSGDYQFLPLDTRHFKDLELEILDVLGNLDEALDGELVHSENWQALNSLRKRYAGKVKCVYIDPPFNLESSDQFDYRTNYKDSCWITMLENRLELAKKFISDDGSVFVRCGHDGNHLFRFLMNYVFGEENYRNEVIVRRAEEQKGELMKQFDTMRAMMVNYDNLYWYSKNSDTRFGFITKPANEQQKASQWHSFWKAENRPNLRYKIFDVDLSKEKRGQWMWSRDRAFRAVDNYHDYMKETVTKNISLENYYKKNADEYRKRTGHKLEFIMQNSNSKRLSSVKYWVPPREFVISDNNWMDIKGYDNSTIFKTENSETLLRRIIEHLVDDGFVFDFFSGSGTTQAVAQKLNRKWLGVEMGEHFHTVILPRIKKTLGGNQSGISREVNYKGGGAFKYCTLEQYEETLRNSHYQDGQQLELDSTKSPFEQYVFFGDDKLAHAVNPKKDSGKLEIKLKNLYPDIDIAESLSNILGKQIRKRTAETVTFADGTTEKTDPATMTEHDKQHFISLIRTYLWWGE